MDSDNYDTPGYALEQWEFDDSGSHQLWTVELQYNGYYRIKSALSGLYMATQAGGEGTEDLFILQENYVDTDRQLWKITLTSHGSYKIKAKSSEPYASDLAVVAANMVNGSSNGIQVQQRLYVNNNSYKDEWYFSKHQIFYFTVNNYFDNGYSVRFNETNEQSAAKINSYMEAVADRYFELLGIIVEYNSAEYYESQLDICKGTVTEDNLDGACGCSVDHTNSDVLVDLFEKKYTEGNNVTANVYWSGHKITLEVSYPNGDVIPYDNRSFSSTKTSTVFMLDIEKLNRDFNSKGILMHELNHQLGAPDHYHDEAIEGDDDTCKNKELCSTCGITKRSPSCIMNISRTDITSETVLCDACRADIIAHLKSHHE